MQVTKKKNKPRFLRGENDNNVNGFLAAPTRYSYYIGRCGEKVNHDTIRKFIEDKINDKVEVTLLSEYTNYFGTTKSFKMVCNSAHNKTILEPTLWPKGTIIRRFFEKRKVNQAKHVSGVKTDAVSKGASSQLNQQATIINDVNRQVIGVGEKEGAHGHEMNMDASNDGVENIKQT